MLNTTLCYIEQDGKYLMLHRVKKKNDINHDKWIGIGGKFEEKESPEDCALREVREETGLTLTSYAYRGLVTFVSDRYERRGDPGVGGQGPGSHPAHLGGGPDLPGPPGPERALLLPEAGVCGGYPGPGGAGRKGTLPPASMSGDKQKGTAMLPFLFRV